MKISEKNKNGVFSFFSYSARCHILVIYFKTKFKQDVFKGFMPKNRKIFLKTEKRRETKKHTKVTKCNAEFDEISAQKV